MGALTFGEAIKIGSASTLAEGKFDDVAQALEMTHHRVPEDSLTTSTTVSAEIHDLSVGRKPVLTVKKVQATFHGRSPRGSGEPSLALAGDTTIEGLAIDGFALVVDLNIEPFQKYDTRAKLLTAADDPEFLRSHGANFFMTSAFEGQAATPVGRIIERNAVTYATIVRSIKWAGAAHPTAKIDHNTIVVPDLGRVFVGEMLITGTSRRLTMLRFKLGSIDGGDFSGIDVDSNGSWSP
jgi:hypothetical protein